MSAYIYVYVYVPSFYHMLLLCSWVGPAWFGSQLNYKVNKNEITTFSKWLNSLIGTNMGNKQENNFTVSQVAFTCWNIWKERCNAIFNQKIVSPLQVIHMINCADGSLWRLVEEIKRLQLECRQIQATVQFSTWHYLVSA